MMSLQKCQLFSQSTVKEIICLLKTQYIDCHIYKFCDAEKLLFLLIIIIVIIVIIIVIIIIIINSNYKNYSNNNYNNYSNNNYNNYSNNYYYYKSQY